MYLGLALISKALVLLTNFFLIKPKQILFDPSHSVRSILCYHTPSLEVKAHWLCSSELWHAQCASSMVQTYYAAVHLCTEVQKVIKRWSEQSEQASWTVLLAYPLFLPNLTWGTSLSFYWQKLKDKFSHSEKPSLMPSCHKLKNTYISNVFSFGKFTLSFQMLSTRTVCAALFSAAMWNCFHNLNHAMKTFREHNKGKKMAQLEIHW